MFDCANVTTTGVWIVVRLLQEVLMKVMPLHRDGIRELRKASSELKGRLEAGEPVRV
jgi:hypothetical protein